MTPPFDQTRPDHANDLAGDDEEDFVEECDCSCHHCLSDPARGCMVVLTGAIIGLLLGTGAAIAGSHAAAWYFDVEVPWPW